MHIRPFALALAAVLALACKTSGSSAEGGRAESDRMGTSGSASAEEGTAGSSASGTASSDAAGGMRSGAGTSDMRGHASDKLLTGTVSKVSGDEIEIQDALTGTTKKLKVVDETLVTIDGRQSQVDQLQEGQLVRASFNEIQGDEIAVRIEGSSMGSPGTSSDMGGTGTTGSDPGSTPSDTAPSQEPESGTGSSPADEATPSPGTKY